MRGISRLLRRFVADNGGATAIEYGLIASLVVVVIIAGIGAVGNQTTTMYNVISSAISAVL